MISGSKSFFSKLRDFTDKQNNVKEEEKHLVWDQQKAW